MSNAIRISRTGGGAKTDFRLQATNIIIDHDRSPISAPLPGGDPILLDLGQWRVNISIAGTASLPGTDVTDGGVAIADMDDIALMADSTATNRWHTNTITLTDTTSSITLTYTVKITGVRLEKQDARDYYNFTMRLTGFMINNFDP